MLTIDFTAMLVRELNGLRHELELFPDDDTIWQSVPGVGNSAGNLALHVAGNVRYFIGSVLGGTGYVRDRAAEFGRRSGRRPEIQAELDDAAAVVREVLGRLPADRLDSPFPDLPGRISTRRFLLHLCVHAGYHLGQVGYLRRILTGDTQASGALGLTSITETN